MVSTLPLTTLIEHHLDFFFFFLLRNHQGKCKICPNKMKTEDRRLQWIAYENERSIIFPQFFFKLQIHYIKNPATLEEFKSNIFILFYFIFMGLLHGASFSFKKTASPLTRALIVCKILTLFFIYHPFDFRNVFLSW